MSGFNYQMDIAKSVKTIENLKSSLLKDVSNIYDKMAKGAVDSYEIGADLSNLIINSYLLGEKLGVNTSEINKNIISKLKIDSLNEDNKLQNELKSLLKNLDK